MKILLLTLSILVTSFVTGNAQASNCDTHSTDKKVKGSGI